MPKFIITHTEIYEYEAETSEEAQEFWRNELLTGIGDQAKFIEGSTLYYEVEDN
jgi:hypothetical protein